MHHKGDFNVNMHLLSHKYVLDYKSILLKRINNNSIQFNVINYHFDFPSPAAKTADFVIKKKQF